MILKLLASLYITLTLIFIFPHVSIAEGDIGALLGEAIEDINFQSFDMAEEKLTAVLKAEPENPYAKYYMASLLSQTKRSKAAIPYLTSIQDPYPLFPDYDNLLASVYMAANMPEKAAPIYKKILALDMLNKESIFQYAGALAKNGQTDLALAYYNTLTKQDSGYVAPAYFQIANVFMTYGASKHALKAFNSIDPTSSYGEIAKSYGDSLSASTQLLNLYLSGEYFYSDNPGSASSTYAKGAVPQASAQGSGGETFIAVLSSAAWEVNYQTQLKFAYTYYTTLYAESFAKGNEFTGHFFSPTLNYTFSPQWLLSTKFDYQLLSLGKYRLSNNYGAGITLTYTSQDQLSAMHTSFNYLQKRYNPSFGEPGLSVDMQYLDANAPAFGLGGYTVYSDYNAVLSLDYNLSLENTLSHSNAILNEKAKDSVYREHSLSLNHHLPFSGTYADLSFDISVTYAYKNYLNPQSGTSLPSIKPGNYFTATNSSVGLKLNYNFGTSYHLNSTLGYDISQGNSAATELVYKQSRYHISLSGSY